MAFRFSSLYLDNIISYIFKTEDQKLLVNIDSTLNFIFAYKIEKLSFEPYYETINGEYLQLDTPHFLLKYIIFIKDSENNIWESAFLKNTSHILEVFHLSNENFKINHIHLYQDLDQHLKKNIESNLLAELNVAHDNRCYFQIQIRNQTTFIGAKYGIINFRIYANLLNTKNSYLKQDTDDIQLFVRADESNIEKNVDDDYIFPERLQYGSYEVPSLCATYKNPIHQALEDSLVNQFYSYFSKKKLNTLIFTRSAEVIEDLPICFDLVDKKDFKPDFTQ